MRLRLDSGYFTGVDERWLLRLFLNITPYPVKFRFIPHLRRVTWDRGED